MRRKERTTDTVIRTDTRESDGYRYRYELIMKQGDGVATWRIPLYSIKVHLTHPDGTCTSRDVRDVFADAGKALLFYEKVLRNLATPIDLIYALEDEITT